jgi:hypothetical protein
LVTLCLALAAGTPQAEWQSMGASAEGELFVDAERLRRGADGTVAFWQLETLATPRKAPNGKSYAAISRHYGLRCEDGSYALLARRYHPKANGEGGTVFADPSTGKPRWLAADDDDDMARWLPGLCYRANVLELFEKREQESGARLRRQH